MQNGLAATVILDFRPRLENRCKDFLVSGLLRALILKFKPRLENRCKDFPVYGLLRAVILDLRGSIWESLQGFAYRISSLNDVRVRFYFSLRQRRIVPPATSVAAKTFRVQF